MEKKVDEKILCKLCGKVWYLRPYCFQYSDFDKVYPCECGNDINASGSTFSTFIEMDIQVYLDENYKKYGIYGLLAEEISCFGVSFEDMETLIRKNNIKICTKNVEGDEVGVEHFTAHDAMRIINRENFWKEEENGTEDLLLLSKTDSWP